MLEAFVQILTVIGFVCGALAALGVEKLVDAKIIEANRFGSDLFVGKLTLDSLDGAMKDWMTEAFYGMFWGTTILLALRFCCGHPGASFSNGLMLVGMLRMVHRLSWSYLRMMSRPF